MKNSAILKILSGTSLIIGAAAASYVLFGRPRHLRWGATDHEIYEPLPGDEVKPDADVQVTHAITINAPAEIVWKWLVQIGQGRGGFYSYDFIENLFGLDIHNTDQIRSDLQVLSVGQFIRSAREGWLGGRFRDKTGWYVVELDPARALVLRDEVDHGSWAFILKPIGANSTRLVIRARGSKPANIPLKIFHYAFFEPAHFIMERKMLLTLKRLSESIPASPGAGEALPEVQDENHETVFNSAAVG